MVFPSTIWNPATVTEITPADVNETITELTALMNTLGTEPHGECASLRHRLDMILSATGEELAHRLVQPTPTTSALSIDDMSQRFRVYPLSAWHSDSSQLATGEYPAGTSQGYRYTAVSHTFVGATSNQAMYRYTFTFSPPDPAIDNLGIGNRVQSVFVACSNSDLWIAEKFAPNSTTSFNLISPVPASTWPSGSFDAVIETYPAHVIIMERFPSETGDTTGY